jgi:hypothetical protein
MNKKTFDKLSFFECCHLDLSGKLLPFPPSPPYQNLKNKFLFIYLFLLKFKIGKSSVLLKAHNMCFIQNTFQRHLNIRYEFGCAAVAQW